jgi:hypothetical protein
MDGEPQSPNYVLTSRVPNTVASNEVSENILPMAGVGNYAGWQVRHQLRQVLPTVDLYRRKIVYCHTFSGLCVTYKTGFGLDELHSLTPYTFNSGIHVITAVSHDLHNLQFTLAHALRFSVFTSRILATDFITVSM